MSNGVIEIHPKLSLEEAQDEREIRDPKVRAAIQASHAEFAAGKSRPAKDVFANRTARAKKLND